MLLPSPLLLLLLLQVFLNASANVTVGYVFNGIPTRDSLKWVPQHVRMWDQTVSRSVGPNTK